MLSGKNPNDPRLRGGLKRQPLSLDLHTMPKTGSSHFQKWLLLALLVTGLLILVALIMFW